jgi:crossover junction endodeoxyribonuclease RuvC
MYNLIMKILGIDPGYERLGIAIVEKDVSKNNGKEILLYSDCFQTSPKLPHHERLQLVGAEIARVTKKFQPKTLAIETLFFSKNVQTAMKVAEARGVIIYEAIRQGLSIVEFSPQHIKMSITSSGNADKKSIIKMIPLLIKTNGTIKHDDEFDAIAIALTWFAFNKIN